MRIREATESDKPAWDNFVNTQGGMFHQYYDWKQVYKAIGQSFFPLMIEDDKSELVGIFSLVREDHKFYSLLFGAGFKSVLFRNPVPSDRQYEITSAVIKYIEDNYASRCATFLINDQLPVGFKEEQDRALIDSGFRIRYNKETGLPCSHVLPLESPFEEKIWKGLWSQKLRQALNKVEKKGIVVIQDRDLKYVEEYVKNVIANYKRHGHQPPSREFLITAFKVFKNNTKLFAALDHDKPVALLSCIYTPSTCYLWEIGTPGKETGDVNKYCYKKAIQDACNEGYKYVDFLGSYTTGLSSLKKRFGTQQTPIMVYEKRYSAPRVLLRYGPLVIKYIFQDRKYIWDNKSKIWDAIRRW